jgi:hypothetical protein
MGCSGSRCFQANGSFLAEQFLPGTAEMGASETKFELTAGREAVLVDQLARNVHELWHAVSFLLAKLARSRISSGKNNCVDWRTGFKLQ